MMPSDTPDISPEYMDDVGQVDDFTEDDIHEFMLMVCELPSMVWGEHLIRTDAQVKRFSHQVYLYCRKKSIDPMDYLFDEFGLVFSGAVLLQGYRADQKKHKGGRGASETHIPVEDDGIHQTVASDKYEPPDAHEHSDTGSGGDNLPEEPSAFVVDEDPLNPTSTDGYVMMGGVPVE